MEPEIRPISGEEFEPFAGVIEEAFGQMSPEDLELERSVFEAERSLAAFQDGRMVGTAGAYTFQLTVPGGMVPAAGVTQVGVLPTHRRRGVLTSLMRRQLDDIRDRGEPMAALWASESVIYGRFGYGDAAPIAALSLERSASAFVRRVQDPGRTLMVNKDEAMKLMPGVYDLVRPNRPGMVDRDERWWKAVFSDLEGHRDGAGPLRYAVHEDGAGEVDGYVAYRTKQNWSEAIARGELQVEELMAANPAAHAALWRLCLDVDLIEKITAWSRPVDDPLVLLLADPRRLKRVILDGVWLRLVDVPASLEARRYRVAGGLTIQVVDPFCPWTEGRYELEVAEDGGAGCRRSQREPDLVIEEGDLASAYLGRASFDQILWSGRLSEETPGAARLADLMFGWDIAPWNVTIF